MTSYSPKLIGKERLEYLRAHLDAKLSIYKPTNSDEIIAELLAHADAAAIVVEALRQIDEFDYDDRETNYREIARNALTKVQRKEP